MFAKSREEKLTPEALFVGGGVSGGIILQMSLLR